MRKSILCGLALLALCSSGFGQKKVPYSPTVIVAVALANQASPIPTTTMFTPMTLGMYRLSAYIQEQGTTVEDTGWGCRIDYSALGSGADMLIVVESLLGANPPTGTVNAMVFVPQPGAPVTFQTFVAGSPSPGTTYDLIITIEQMTP